MTYKHRRENYCQNLKTSLLSKRFELIKTRLNRCDTQECTFDAIRLSMTLARFDQIVLESEGCL